MATVVFGVKLPVSPQEVKKTLQHHFEGLYRDWRTISRTDASLHGRICLNADGQPAASHLIHVRRGGVWAVGLTAWICDQ